MNAIKVFINNFERLAIESFNRTKIIIEDFPKITGIIFLTKLYAVTKLRAQILLRWLDSSFIYVLTNIKPSINSRMQILQQIYSISIVRFIINYRLNFIGKTYIKSRLILRILNKLKYILSKVYLKTKIAFKMLYYYKVIERRDMLIRDCRDMTIKDFISLEIE